MADSLQVQIVTTLLDGASTERTATNTKTISDLSEEFWITTRLAAGASTTLALGSLTDPDMLLIFGGEGIWVKLDATQAAHWADPFFVISNVHDGLDLSSVILGNDSAQEQAITIITVEE